jgi:hypothetical protein
MRIHLLILSGLLWAGAAARGAEAPAIRPGDVWEDDRGKMVQAHGGGVVREGETYYWFGEDRSPDLERGHRAVACYASKDLMKWEFRRRVVDETTIEGVGRRWVLERPKVYHNAKTGKYVLYAHVDGPIPGDGTALGGSYGLARVGV